MELRGERARTFVQVRSLLNRGVVTGGDAEELMSGLTKLFRAQSAAIAQGFSFAGWNVASNVPASWLPLHTRYAHEDPSRAALADTQGETFLIDRDLTPIQKDCSLYFHLRDQGFRDGLIASLYNPFISDLAIVMYRAAGTRPFDAIDEELFRTLYPHLAGGLAARRALAALHEPARETLNEVLPRLDGYVFLTSPGGAITWSAKARALWTAMLGISGDAGWARAEGVLRASALQFHSPFAGGRSQTIIPGIRIEWASVPPRRGEARRMVGLMIAERSADMELSALEGLLTERQRHVARAAVRGRTARQIAEALSISTETVRWTLREIYRRLGVRNRADLVTALSRSRLS